jgi:hypothetical protein
MIISICPLVIVFLRARGIQSGKGALFRPEQVASQRAAQSAPNGLAMARSTPGDRQ